MVKDTLLEGKAALCPLARSEKGVLTVHFRQFLQRLLLLPIMPKDCQCSTFLFRQFDQLNSTFPRGFYILTYLGRLNVRREMFLRTHGINCQQHRLVSAHVSIRGDKL